MQRSDELGHVTDRETTRVQQQNLCVRVGRRP